MADEDKSLDVLGIKPIADSVNTLTKGTVDGTAALLSRICLPAAEEIGFYLRDKVKDYRKNNILKITQEAEAILANYSGQTMHAHPRLVAEIMEHGSWSDDDAVQKKWSGLLISSCDDTGKDDSNLIFIDLLRQLSHAEVKILDYACQNSNKIVVDVNVLSCNQFSISGNKISEISGVNDVHRIHRELAHLRTLGLLIDGEIHERHDQVTAAQEGNDHEKFTRKNNPKFINYTFVNVTPSDLAFHLYTRSKGFTGSPIEYFFGEDYFNAN